ncbi:hypothetical protein SK224_08150 [Microbacterium sp. BG28]|uniref:hypothetical protein n=1 Tax=Microbacterium sp. BG28 TaxID=3097356 RepID=UPI002A5AEF7E|nr:hypothetical protein [Microbacterium sp. BG28]MDY0829099.1 hypothetical protein [Microbacterium sp. BG28]
MSITEDRPDIEAVRALEGFIAKDGRGEHLLTFQGILRSHEALREEVQAYHDRAVTAEGTAREALARAAALANGVAALPETPTTDDRDLLTLIARDVHLYDGGSHQALLGIDARRIGDAILAAGFRRPSPPTEEPERTVTFANERQVEALFAESSDHEMVFVNAINEHLIVGLSEDGECFYQGVPEALNEEGTEVDPRRGWLRNLREAEWPLTLMVKAEAAGFRRPSPPTEEQVEAAARAMFEDPDSHSSYSWKRVVVDDPRRAAVWRADARRALEAAARVGGEA